MRREYLSELVGSSFAHALHARTVPMRLRLIPIIFLALTANGLLAQRVRENDPERVVGHPPRLKEPSRITASFSGLRGLIQQIQTDAPVEIFRGVPRKRSASKESDKVSDQMVARRYGSDFYIDPIPGKAESKRRITDRLRDPSAYSRFSGFKFCGGFHPDWSFVYQLENNAIEIHFCLTCHEIKLFQGRREVYCDVDADSYCSLIEILKDFSLDK